MLKRYLAGQESTLKRVKALFGHMLNFPPHPAVVKPSTPLTVAGLQQSKAAIET